MDTCAQVAAGTRAPAPLPPESMATHTTTPQDATDTSQAALMLSVLTSIKSALWDDASVDQRKLTLQLARNSLYFSVSVFLIKQFGEQVAI